MPNLGGGKARYNLRDVPKVNSLFLNLNIYTCTHVHISEIKIGGGGGAQTECTYYRGLENSQCT